MFHFKSCLLHADHYVDRCIPKKSKQLKRFFTKPGDHEQKSEEFPTLPNGLARPSYNVGPLLQNKFETLTINTHFSASHPLQVTIIVVLRSRSNRWLPKLRQIMGHRVPFIASSVELFSAKCISRPCVTDLATGW